MSRRNFVEISCDGCEHSQTFVAPVTNKMLQDQTRWVIIGRKHYCSFECMEKME